MVEVGEQNRVRLLLEVQTIVPWLKSEQNPIDCIGTVGAVGGVQIELFSAHELLRDEFAEALGKAPSRSIELGRKWVDAARLLATSWRMSARVESSRISITLPEPIRRAGLLPGVGGLVVVFGCGEILEIWDATRWHEHAREIARGRLAAISDAIEELEDR
jgi:hypothetical protein